MVPPTRYWHANTAIYLYKVHTIGHISSCRSDISLNRDLVTELDLIIVFDVITLFREVCGKPTEDAYSSGHLVLSHMGLAFVLMLRPFLHLSCLRTFEFRTSLGTSILPSIMLRCMDQIKTFLNNLCCRQVKIDGTLGIIYRSLLSNAPTFRNDCDDKRSV